MKPDFDPGRAFRVDDCVCAITGGANGIGLSAALALARAGGRVHLLDRHRQSGEAALQAFEDIGLSAEYHELDVTNEDDVERAFSQIAKTCGRLDVLVSSAGLAIRRPSVDLPLADWNTVINVNLTGVFLCARGAARHMIAARRGAIINLASIMGLSGGGLYPNASYQASKGAVVNLTRALAVEWAPHNIRVNAVAPTWVRTEFVRPLIDNPETMAKMEALTPLGRIADTADVAGAILFLASPAAAMITGHILPVDGGYLAQ
ncbi:SDR family NAD(P)-dependent oxidoreductase [soil metagenome]